MWILQAMMMMWSDVVSSLSSDFLSLNFHGFQASGLFFFFFRNVAVVLLKKKGRELKCPDGMEEVCEALALLTRFIIFFSFIYKKENNKRLCRLFTTSHVG